MEFPETCVSVATMYSDKTYKPLRTILLRRASLELRTIQTLIHVACLSARRLRRLLACGNEHSSHVVTADTDVFEGVLGSTAMTLYPDYSARRTQNIGLARRSALLHVQCDVQEQERLFDRQRMHALSRICAK